MTVRVWMRPSELGEAGYSVDFPADSARRLKNGRLLLLAEDPEDPENPTRIGDVHEGRWDAFVVLEDAE